MAGTHLLRSPGKITLQVTVGVKMLFCYMHLRRRYVSSLHALNSGIFGEQLLLCIFTGYPDPGAMHLERRHFLPEKHIPQDAERTLIRA